MHPYLRAIIRPFTSLESLLIGGSLTLIASVCAGSIAFIAATPEFGSIQNILLMVLLGIVLLFLTILVAGYSIECGITFDILPPWKIKNALKKGLVGSSIGILYSIPFLLLFLFVVGPSQLNAQTIEPSTGLTLVMMLGLFTFYLIPVAILEVLRTKKFKRCFEFMVILKKSFSSDYPLAFLVSFAYTFLFIFLLATLNQWPLVGMIVSSFVGFALRVTSMTLYGEALQEIEIVKNE